MKMAFQRLGKGDAAKGLWQWNMNKTDAVLQAGIDGEVAAKEAALKSQVDRSAGIQAESQMQSARVNEGHLHGQLSSATATA